MPEVEASGVPITYVDVTELVVFQLRTGIQRVVRELVHHGRAGAAAGSLVPVIAVGGHFHALNDAGLRRIEAASVGQAERKITHERDTPVLVRLGKRAAAFSPVLYNWLQRLYVRRTTYQRSVGLYDADPVRFAGKDTLVLLDSFWGGSSTLAAAEGAKRLGARVVLVAYDLIPITDPQFCDARLVQKFARLMKRAVATSDLVVAISDFCAQSFRTAFANANVVSFPLGHDVRLSATNSDPASWPEGLWTGDDPIFLVVGSIEPRKGHEVILDAFDRNWAGGGRHKLLIIGKVGWSVELLMRRFDSHRLAGDRLFVVHHASDAMLAHAIARADAAIIASFVEGFGLPLVEALAAGLPVIASDIPVFREIAGDAVRYFAPGEAVALEAAVGDLTANPAGWREKAGLFEWPDWQRSAQIFYELLKAPTDMAATEQRA